ncbi:HAMP domain-containing sensor histidine kinase [Peribacillus butanolivorans]|uniref:HAMP domain-containing sensor histidine kinase n=1 Tax=Peribacillus butanolivorans TaxID=421767 RepID=UPI00367D8C44
MLNRVSIKWKMTIFSAIFIFIIFIFCNLIQLILIQTFTSKQEQEQLYKRSEEIRTIIMEQSKQVSGKDLLVSEDLFEKIVERNEMIRVLDKDGNELYNISNDFPDQDKALKNGFYRMEAGDEDLLLIKEPLRVDSFNGTLEIGKNIETFDTFMEKVIWVLVLGTFLSLALSLVSGWFLVRKLLSPLTLMTNTMRKIEDNQFQERVPVMESKDEFSQLSIIFNSMMDRIEASMSQQKRFVEDASHELRTPLAIIHGHLSLLQRWGKNKKDVLDSSLHTSIKETDRMIELTNELLLLTRMDKLKEVQGPFIPCNGLETINEVLNDYQLIHEQLKINREEMVHCDTLLAIPQEQLKQILIIILDNAIKYSGEGKEVTIKTSNEKDKYNIEIHDNGYGISQEDMPYIFDRFYRVDKARSRGKGGNGLGLSIAKDITEEYKGAILAESTIGKGTVIILQLPLIHE